MDLEIKYQKTKTLSIKENGRSSDFVTPNFILGCNAGCSKTYCYTRRFGRKFIYVNTNIDEILRKIYDHSKNLGVKFPNQVDDKYWVYDIGCDTDIIYHWKNYDWFRVLDFFNDIPNIKATFATKFSKPNLGEYVVKDNKIRIRFSIMPQNLSNLLEPYTAKNSIKLKQIESLKKAGWDVHINFSPIIVTDTWLKDYEILLEQIKQVDPLLKFECIFLTHNEYLHNFNILENRIIEESYLWVPEIQENKISEYGGNNVRYSCLVKPKYISDFKKVFNNYFDSHQIRYIF